MSPSTSVLPFEPTTKISPASDSGLPDDVMKGDACAGAFADIFGETADGGTDKPVGSLAIDAAVVAGLAMTPVGTPIPMHLAMAKTCGLTPGIVPAEAVSDDSDGSVTDAMSDEAVSDDNESVEETDDEGDRSVADSRLSNEGSPPTPHPLVFVEGMVAAAKSGDFPIEACSFSETQPPPALASQAVHLRRLFSFNSASTGQPPRAAGADDSGRDGSQIEPYLVPTSTEGSVPVSSFSSAHSVVGIGPQSPGPGITNFARSLDTGDSGASGSQACLSPASSAAQITDAISDLAEPVANGQPDNVGSTLKSDNVMSGDSPPPSIVGFRSVGPQSRAPSGNRFVSGQNVGNSVPPANSGIPASASSETNPADVLSKSVAGASGGKPDMAGESPLPEGNTLKSGEDLPGKIPPAVVVGSRSLAAGIRVSTVTAEKYADSAAQIQSTRKTDANLSTGINKKGSLDSSDESLMDHGSRVGTETAILVTPMLHDSRHPRYAALQGEPIASGVGHSAEQGSLGRAASEAAAPNSKGAVAAVEAIRQITDAADVLWATERSGVNLKLKLDDVGVAVSVSYRNGEIRATFHADSPELRNALSTAWEKHVFSISDQKPYRFAEPVFSSSNTSSNGEQGAFAQGYSMGGDSPRQSSHQAQRGNPDVIRRSRRGISSVGAPVAPSRTTQVSENSSRLQAFA